MFKKIFLVLVLLKIILAEKSVPLPQVTTPLGVLEGHIKFTITDKPFFAFESVPYAEPPIGELRFERPVPKKPWKGIRQAKNTTKCLQYSHEFKDDNDNYLVAGEEDCLFVNIYSHDLSSTANKDVLVYIHGGAFIFGVGNAWGPRIAMNRDMVYVNLNYRLGVLGFLSTEDNVLPGNDGLRDQITALKFIKENIKYFGGNPDSITIWGLSAGGASVHLHYLMPQSKGLFNQGISQSGCALNPWVLVENVRQRTNTIAQHLDCPIKSSYELKSCLKNKPLKDIVQSIKLLQSWLFNPFSPLGVVVDKWAKDSVLPDHPYNLLKDGKVQDLPWMITYTTEEGLYPAAEFYAKEKYLRDIDERWNEIMPFILHYNDTIESDLKDKVSQKIREFYMAQSPVNRETYSKLVKIMSDRLFIADLETSARLHNAAVKSNVYSYVFGYRGASSKTVLRAKTDKDIGVSHGDDTCYVASSSFETWHTENDRKMIEIFLDMFTSFMKTGKPNISTEWLPLEKSKSAGYTQLRISSPSEIVLETLPEIGHKSFWDNLPFKENHHLFGKSQENIKQEL